MKKYQELQRPSIQLKGKGHAIRKSVPHANGKLVSMCDADLSIPINEQEILVVLFVSPLLHWLP